MRTRHSQSAFLPISLIAFATIQTANLAFAEDAAKPDASAQAAIATIITPRDAGARYGQALGTVEICYGSKITDKGKTLGDAFIGTDQADFKAQSAKIFEAWVKVKNCSDQRDPNLCKIIMDKSCLAAEAEIGVNGTVMPGLVDFAKH